MNEYYIISLPDLEKNKSLNDKKIIIFGLGRLGKKIIDFTLNRNYNIIEIWDNYPKVDEYKGIKVCKPHNKQDKNIPIIISANIANIDKLLYSQAKDLGYINVLNFGELFICEKLFYNEYSSFINDIQRFKIKKLYSNKNDIVALSHIDLQITERCTLKCKECSSLMQYYTNPKDLDIDEALETIDKLLSSVDYIERIHILGGEPFMCKELHRYMEILKKYDNVGIIGVITNATILPSGRNLECLKYEKVQVRISDYGELSRNLTNLVELFEKEHIFYNIFKVTNWYKCAGFEKHNRSDDQNKKIFTDCMVASCYTLRNQKLFHCPFAANSWALHSIPEDSIEYVDFSVDDKVEIRENIRAYINNDILKTCDYCIGRPLIGCEPVKVAEQTKKILMYRSYIE